jgi:hypothetical protein
MTFKQTCKKIMMTMDGLKLEIPKKINKTYQKIINIENVIEI